MTQPPVANFSFSPTSGKSPLTVNFKDESTGNPVSWLWDFGDSFVVNEPDTSTDQNPVHEFVDIVGEGITYTVTLIVTNALGVKSVPVSHDVVLNNSEFPLWAIILITLLSVIILFLIIFLPLYYAPRRK
jgi:PKD repeat protein